MFKHILLPTDGSEFSQNTVKSAIAFAKETGARITAFFAKQQMSMYLVGSEEVRFPSAERFAELAEQEAQEILGSIEKQCREAGVECHKVTQSNNLVHEAIIEAANNNGCDLIFMASHGRRGLSALLLGSETMKVLTHSKIPVLVYR